MFEYVVSFGHELQVNRLVRVASKSDLLREAKQAFKVRGECALKLYHEKFEVHLTVDDLSDMPDTGRLQLESLAPEPSGSQPSKSEPSETSDPVDHLSRADTVSLGAMDTAPDADPNLHRPWIVERHQGEPDEPTRIRTREPDDSTSDDPSPTAQLSEERRDRRTSSPRSPVLDPGLLSRATRDRLEKHAKLTWADWADIQQAILDTYQARHQSLYMDRRGDGYRELAADLIRDYPQAVASLEVEEGNAMDYLAGKIKNKFKNTRKRVGSPTERARRRTTKPCPDGGRIQVRGLPNYNPPVSSDSVLKTEQLLNDLKHNRTEGDTRLEQLKATLHVRRQAIIGSKGKGKKGMRKLKEQFPYLSTAHGVWTEMCLLAGEDIKARYADNFDSLLRKVVQKTHCSDDDAVPTLLRLIGEEDAILKEPDTVTQDPHVQDTAVLVEGHVVGCVDSLKEAVLLLAVALYVFNQRQKWSIKSFAWLMSTEVMMVQGDTNPTPNAKAVIAQLLG